jgi:hypothetical protein
MASSSSTSSTTVTNDTTHVTNLVARAKIVHGERNANLDRCQSSSAEIARQLRDAQAEIRRLQSQIACTATVGAQPVAVVAPYGQGTWGRTVAAFQSFESAGPYWIWAGGANYDASKQRGKKGPFVLTGEVQLDTPPERAVIVFTCDNTASVCVNGVNVGTSDNWQKAVSVSILPSLRLGRNLISAAVTNAEDDFKAPCGFIAVLVVNGSVVLKTDASWKSVS